MEIENEKPSETKQKYKIKKRELKDNEILLDLSSVNLPFEFTPTVPYKIVEFILVLRSYFKLL